MDITRGYGQVLFLVLCRVGFALGVGHLQLGLVHAALVFAFIVPRCFLLGCIAAFCLACLVAAVASSIPGFGFFACILGSQQP